MDTYYYLVELRRRLLHCIIFTGILSCVFCFYANELYHLLALPLLAKLPTGKGLIATRITSTFLVPFKFALVTAIVMSIPYFFYHLWNFVAPALYANEKKWVWILFFPSVILFYVGILFAYVVVLPLMFNFFITITPPHVDLLPDINQYLDLTLQLLLAFGIAFEIPILTLISVKFGILTLQQLRAMRPYVIVGAFVVAMFLTPPDVISQTLLAIPLWFLYEIGCLLARMLKGKE